MAFTYQVFGYITKTYYNKMQITVSQIEQQILFSFCRWVMLHLDRRHCFRSELFSFSGGEETMTGWPFWFLLFGVPRIPCEPAYIPHRILWAKLHKNGAANTILLATSRIQSKNITLTVFLTKVYHLFTNLCS